ncbi:MAG TPA: DUF6345 domain-containing protein [Verrucomicrobiae bacterium]
MKVDGNWYSWEAIYGPMTLLQVPFSPKYQQTTMSQSMVASTETASASATAGAGAAKGPTKPPTKPVKGKAGTFGVAFQQYLPNGYNLSVPSSGQPVPFNKIQIEGSTANFNIDSLPIAKPMAEKFANHMKKNGWSGFIKPDVRAQEIRKSSIGGSNIFGKVNIGFLIAHSVYGTAPDYTSQAQQTFQTYMPFVNNGINDWLRLSECSFGSTNLRWMGMYACSSLRDQNYQSMYNIQVLPINPNLHLLCSTRSFMYINDSIGAFWSLYMHHGATATSGAETVKRAWFLSVRDVYKLVKKMPTGQTVTLRVAGWPNCFGDKLTTYSNPGTSDPSQIAYEDQQVWPSVTIP